MNARFGKPDSLVSAPSELTERRFPPPWIVEELEACFYVCDSAGQKLAFVYFEEEPGRRAAAKLLTKDEARRIAANIAKLPELLRAGSAAEVTTAAGDSDIISLAGSIDPAA